jgi:PAS domain S-box-containing protein
VDYVNQRSSNYHGTTPYRGVVWQQFVHPDDLPHCAERWSACLRTGETYEVEFRLRDSDGHYRWHLARALPVRDDDGKITRWFGTNTDIHERKQIEETLARTTEELARCREELERLKRQDGRQA